MSLPTLLGSATRQGLDAAALARLPGVQRHTSTIVKQVESASTTVTAVATLLSAASPLPADGAGLVNRHLGLLRMAAQRMEQIRSLLGDVPITVLSCYRSEQVNKAVGGSPTSAHRHGLACDFVAPRFGKPLAICHAIEAARAAGRIAFDQLICEFPHSGGWVHIGFRLPPAHGRSQILTAIKRDGHTVYLPGLQA